MLISGPGDRKPIKRSPSNQLPFVFSEDRNDPKEQFAIRGSGID